jgi:alkane 1-monooxygenase
MKSFKKYTYLICFILPVVAYLGYALGGYYNFLTPVLVFMVLPILDALIGKDSTNPQEEEVPGLQNEKYYRYLTYAWTYAQVGFVIWAVYAVVTSPMLLHELIGFTISVGVITGGIGITVAHELGHKNTKIEQFLAKMLLATVCYMHFFIEHNRGHHVNVSTHNDPASSRKGENFYTFYFRTVFGSYMGAWNLEKKRLEKKGLGAFHYSNEMLWYWAIQLGFAGALFAVATVLMGSPQWIALGFFFAQAWIGFSLLELVNYIEHYGLKRKEIAPGKFEKVLPIHSWNANHFVSNAFLFHLQRHSDHHANAGRRYQSLRHFEESPQMPAGYEVMILLAMVPPLWRKVVDPRLEAWEKQYYGDTDLKIAA